MNKEKIIWVDDEIDLLGAYKMFLEEKGYEVHTANNGQDAIDMCDEISYSIMFLDENMPGLSGLETLAIIKKYHPALPIVMITKSEEENIMDMAIGNKIADYLIKPVNPSQILLTLKKHIHQKDILVEHTTTNYRSEFQEIYNKLNSNLSIGEWKELYERLVFWELELDDAENQMHEMLQMQKSEANNAFCKYVKKNYESWMSDIDNRPMMSPDIFKRKIFPMLDNGDKVFMIVIDNFRLDQWVIIKSLLSEFYQFTDEDMYLSILPTATQYARNAIFSGLMPLQIKELYPDLWVDEEEEEGKNLKEEELLKTQFTRYRRDTNFSYHKINHTQAGEKLIEQLRNINDNTFNVCILNFVDMLSHARTESKMIRELASSESAYRSLTLSWFKHTSTYTLFKELAKRGYKVVVTTDHGTIRVKNAIKVVGDRNTNVNLRYKVGKSLAYNKKEVYDIPQPAKIGLPSPNVSSTYIFAYNDDFFAYPNNYNHYVTYFKDTFQHGGISLEEMLIPFVIMEPK